jgi:hypothetical protein
MYLDLGRAAAKVPGLHVTLALVILLLLASVALAHGTWSVYRWVVGGGQVHAERGDYVVNGTFGEPVAGVVGEGPYVLCAGYWCGPGMLFPPEGFRIYLPVVVRKT